MNLSNFKGRIIFMSMYNDFLGRTQGNCRKCVANSLNVAAYANKFSRTVVGHFLALDCEKKWDGTHVNKPFGEWNKVAESMMINFAESGHPMFQATSAFGKRRVEK